MPWPVVDSELFEQLRLLPMMPQEPRVSFKVQEHQVHTGIRCMLEQISVSLAEDSSLVIRVCLPHGEHHGGGGGVWTLHQSYRLLFEWRMSEPWTLNQCSAPRVLRAWLPWRPNHKCCMCGCSIRAWQVWRWWWAETTTSMCEHAEQKLSCCVLQVFSADNHAETPELVLPV